MAILEYAEEDKQVYQISRKPDSARTHSPERLHPSTKTTGAKTAPVDGTDSRPLVHQSYRGGGRRRVPKVKLSLVKHFLRIESPKLNFESITRGTEETPTLEIFK